MAKRPERIAHRGANREARENTLPAFLKALERGADGIELDVHATADGVVVVHQDPVLNADTVSIDNGIGSVNPTNGMVTVTPPVTTTYRLTATNKSGSVNSTASITVRPRPGPLHRG